MDIWFICLAQAVGAGGLSCTHLDDPVLYWQPQPPLPDVLVWMLSGRRRVACARIPAQDVLFSVVEEERGRDCGKIQSLLLTVRGPGARVLGRVGCGSGKVGHQGGRPVVPRQGTRSSFQLPKKAKRRS